MGYIDFLVGCSVQELRLGQSFRIVFELGDRAEPALYADLATTFTYTSASGDVIQAALDLSDRLGETLAIIGAEVTHAHASESGALHLDFSKAGAIDCAPHPEFEAWQVVGGAPEYLVVSVGPNELAVWDTRTPGVDL